MSIVEDLKRTFNIGGSKIDLATDSATYSQADEVSGEVFITTREYEQTGDSITLELKEFWTERTGKHRATKYETHDEVTLAGQFSYESNSEHKFSFTVQLPRNSRISTSDSGWMIVVNMDIPKAIDPTGKMKLNVQPAREFLAIVRTCEEQMKFWENVPSRRWSRKKESTYFRLLPPDVLKPELDYLALELLQVEDESVTGEVIFNLQEKSVADYFKAVLMQDRVKIPLQLDTTQIFLPDGEPNTEVIVQAIAPHMQKVISERES